LLDGVEEPRRVEGLRELAVRAHGRRARRVHRRASTEEQNGDVPQRGIGAQSFTERVSVEAGHLDVGEDQLGPQLARARQGFLSVAHRGQRDVLTSEAEADRFLDGDGVVREENRAGHRESASSEKTYLSEERNL
jgi:hypothetical protein